MAPGPRSIAATRALHPMEVAERDVACEEVLDLRAEQCDQVVPAAVGVHGEEGGEDPLLLQLLQDRADGQPVGVIRRRTTLEDFAEQLLQPFACVRRRACYSVPRCSAARPPRG